MPRSNVDKLPEQLRTVLHQLIQCGQYSIDQLTEIFNDELAKSVPNVVPISRSAIGREAKKVKIITEKSNEINAAMSALGAEMDLTNLGQMGQLVSFMLQQSHYKATADAMAEPDAIDPKTLNMLALAHQRLQRTNMISGALTDQIREQERQAAIDEAKAAAADAVAKAAEQRGLNADEVAFWREQVMGIAPTPAKTE